LEASDYVYQIKRLAHPSLDSPIASLMLEHLVGLKDLANRLAKAASEKGNARSGYIDLRDHELAGAKVIDRYTYEIRVHGKYAQFLYWLAMHFFAPMPWEADRFYSQPGMAERNITLNWYPVGTGPFMLTENNPNRRIVLARNPNFHGETYPSDGEPKDSAAGMLSDAGKAMPFLDKVILVLELESIPYWNKFLQGYYDRSGISSDSFDQAIQIDASGEAELTPAMQEKNIKLVSAAEPDIYYMGFNMRDPIVGGDSERSRKLRQALSIAVDYEEYISIFMNDRGIAAQGPLPPDIFGHTEGQSGINPYVFNWVDGKPKRKSIDEAKRLLAEAGYPNGRDAANGKPLILNLDTASGGPQFKARLDWMRKQFAKINIQLVVRDSDANRFWEKLDKGTAQIFEAGWNADYPDPENFMFLLYGPNGKAEHKGENQTNYVNSEFDRLFEAMRNLDNSAERQRIIDQMMGILRRDAPWVFGFHRVNLTLHHAWYRNAKPIFMANNTLKYRRVDPQLRAEMRAKWNRPIVWPVILIVLILVLSALPAIRVFRQAQEASAL
jgi:ABC-type transport system substrate-binding protein